MTDNDTFESGSSAPLVVPDDIAETQLRLRKEMLDIQNNTTTDEKQKAILMQTLMTRNYVSLAYRNPIITNQDIAHPLSASDLARTYHDEAANIMGCAHYRRNCKLQ